MDLCLPYISNLGLHLTFPSSIYDATLGIRDSARQDDGLRKPYVRV